MELEMMYEKNHSVKSDEIQIGTNYVKDIFISILSDVSYPLMKL